MPRDLEWSRSPYALIYVRASEGKEVRRDEDLNRQERRCRNYAREQGYLIGGVFRDTGSGTNLKSEAMLLLEACVRTHRDRTFVVIVDDLSGFARDIDALQDFIDTLGSLGVEFESPVRSEADPNGVFFEKLRALMIERYRRENAQKKYNRMRSRLQNGYYPFIAPLGYKHAKVAGHDGKVLVPHDLIAPVIKEMLLSYADGRLRTVAEAQLFLNGHPVFMEAKRTFAQHQVENILRHRIYSGRISSETLSVGFIEGNHEPLIDRETYLKIQQRLKKY